VTERFVTRGFVGRREPTTDGSGMSGEERRRRTPPGQYLTDGFPVLSAGPTPRTPLDRWSLTLDGLVSKPITWSWTDFLALRARDWVVDISCVTKWTHLDMRWRGVSVDTLLESVELDPKAAFAIASCDGGYTTNLPLADVLNNQAFVAFEYDGASRSRRSMAVRPGSSYLAATSGRAPSGFAASASRTATSPASGSRSATTTAATNGSRSGTPVTRRPPQRRTR
jgi:hypothetical protein